MPKRLLSFMFPSLNIAIRLRHPLILPLVRAVDIHRPLVVVRRDGTTSAIDVRLHFRHRFTTQSVARLLPQAKQWT
jgi:hypothetical protein